MAEPNSLNAPNAVCCAPDTPPPKTWVVVTLLPPVPVPPLLAAQRVIVLLSSVTAPVDAKALPQVIVAPVFSVMLVCARMLPANAVFVPSVAELPTAQYTLLPLAPSINRTAELLAVVSVLPIWNTNCEAELPWQPPTRERHPNPHSLLGPALPEVVFVYQERGPVARIHVYIVANMPR